ncbi:hypothetical protein N9L20_07425 [Flavobacteriaceae bacterium]|nr:hypothetical protein [Flavobacteriaceae bacterium]
MNKEGKLYQAITFLDEYALEVADIATNGLGYAIIGVLYEIDKPIFWGIIHSQNLGLILLIIVFVLNIVFGVRIIKKNQSKQDLINEKNTLGLKIQGLENELDEIRRNSMEVFNEHLAAIFFKLKLTDKERISFYKFQNDQFHIIGRYSINPELIKRKRKYYPSEEGLIGLAWKGGEFHVNEGIPEFKHRSKKAYYDKIKSFADIDDETLKKMNMKSRSFYLKAFTDLKNIRRNSIIVFESENEKIFELDDIRLNVNNEQQQLVAFIERLKWDLPTVGNAKEKGF